MLKGFDIQAQVVANGLEAVRAVETFEFDVVLMDICMPEMDGVEATRAIRVHGGPSAAVPIIAVTANAYAADIRQCRDAGMNEFLAKPVRKQQMAEAIVRVLDAAAAGIACGLPPGMDAVGFSGTADIPAHNPVVDTATLDALVSEIGVEGARETVDVFLRETEARLRRLRRLSHAAERRTIETEAHTLKGASASLGLRELSGLARILEADAIEARNASYHDYIENLEQAFERARETIPQDLRMAA